MTTPTIISILSGTWRPKGGMTSSALLRSSGFANEGFRSIVYTLDYRADQTEYVQEMQRSGSVGKSVEINNFYEFYRSKKNEAVISEDSSLNLYEQIQDEYLSRYFSNSGELVYNVRRFKDGRAHRRYFDDLRRVTQLEEISANGTLHRRKSRNANSGKFTQETLLCPQGSAYAITWLNENEQESGFFLYEEDETVRFFKNKRLAQIQWIKSEIEKIQGPVALIVDNPENMDIVNSVVFPNVRKVGVFHGNHLIQADDPNSGVIDTYAPFFDTTAQWDALICSTEKQVSDLSQHFKNDVLITRIPQAIDQKPIRRNQEKDSAAFAYFGRFVALKRLPQLVKAFSRVIKMRPKAVLALYGEGPISEQVRQTITSEGIEGSVLIKGFESDVRSEMSRYAATLLCSQREGFGLVVGESMACGVPVIAMDCNYGPGEIIDETSGILVPNNDFNRLIHSIIWCIDNPSDVEELGRNALVRIEQEFSRQGVTSAWARVVRNLFVTE